MPPIGDVSVGSGKERIASVFPGLIGMVLIADCFSLGSVLPFPTRSSSLPGSQPLTRFYDRTAVPRFCTGSKTYPVSLICTLL